MDRKERELKRRAMELGRREEEMGASGAVDRPDRSTGVMAQCTK